MRKPGDSRQSSGQLEVVAAALEVLVELAPHLVEAAGRLEHPGADPVGELVEDLVVVLGLEGEPHEARRRGRDEERTDRAVGRGVGDVDELLRLGAGQGGGEVGGRIGGRAAAAALLEGSVGHREDTSWRSAARPARTFWRAAASEQPSTTPMSAYGRSPR